MYYGDSFADLATMRLEGKIKRIYAQAYREIEEKLNTFLAKSAKKEQEYLAKVKNGLMTQEQFDSWKEGQVFTGKRWQDLRQSIAVEIYNSRKSATDMINGERKAVFQDNVNYAQYSIDKDYKFALSFTLYDNATVTRLIKDDPDLVPDVKYPAPQIDYAWSKKQITSAITQGVLQGESIPKLARRIGKKLESSNTASMVRCARTAMTGAQNSGRIEAMHNAQNKGIKVQKLWISTLDERTRSSHRDLDGQIAEVDKPFHSLLGDIMFPGDPNATPANVWNCFVGNTKVASDSEIIRSYKHDYSGELVTVKTASGVEFTCTPNHPILTDRGWVGAKFLNNGDRLAETRCIKIDFLGVDPDIDHTLSCFDTIHKFFEEVGIKRTCSLGVNFHGDIPTTNVEIVSKERLLWNYGDSCEFQSKDKLGFKCTTPFAFSKGYFMSGFRRGHVSFLSFVSRMRQTLSFFLARISHSGIHGLGTVSNMDSCIVESKRNSVSGNVQFLGESLAGLSSRVFFDNIVDIKTSSVSHVPVYNLQTQNGYYFVSSDSSIKSDSEKINGIFVIAHNCRCTLGWDYPEYSNQYDTRAARDDNPESDTYGKTIEIPDMTYKEWEKWKKTGQLPQRGLSLIYDNKPQQPQESKLDKIGELKKALESGNESLYDVGKRMAEIMHEKFEEFKSSNSVNDLKSKLEEAEFDIDYINLKNTKSLLEDALFWNVLSKDFSSIEESVLHSIRDGLKVLKWSDKKIKTEFDDKIKNSTFTTNDFKSISQKVDKVLKEKDAYITDLRYKLQNSALLRGRNSAQILKETLSNFREVGADGIDLKLHLQNSRSPVRPVVEEAYTYYPKTWVESSVKRGSLSVKKTDRGYYNGIEIAISGYGDSSFGTAIHELGHRFEDAVKGIKQEESEFYSRRTTGEKLEWLGRGYGLDELTRKDNFLDPYMGKDYHGYAYELVSMGFQYAYTDPERLAKDEDMESWIYGLLLTK